MTQCAFEASRAMHIILHYYKNVSENLSFRSYRKSVNQTQDLIVNNHMNYDSILAKTITSRLNDFLKQVNDSLNS